MRIGNRDGVGALSAGGTGKWRVLMGTEGLRVQGRALYSFFRRVKVLQNRQKHDPDHEKFNPQNLWISQWTITLQNSRCRVASGLQPNWRFFRH
jgi:hypothetical protein